MSVITWRNVDSGSLGNPTQTMALGGATINAGFDKLGELLKQREALDESNWKVGQENNTQAFLNEIGKYRSPEEYQAALASGAIDQARQQYGAQINQAAARSAQDGHKAILQSRGIAEIGYNNAIADNKDAPILDEVYSLTAQGKLEEARKKASELNRNQGKAQKHISETERSDTQFGQNNIKFGQGLVKHESDMLTDTAQRAVLQAQARELDARHSEEALAAKLSKAAGGAGSTNPNAIGSYSPEAAKAFVQGTSYKDGSLDSNFDDAVTSISKIVKDPEDQGKVIRAMSNLPKTFTTEIQGKDGKPTSVTFPIPNQVLINNIGKSYGHGFFGIGQGHYANSFKLAVEEDLKANASKYANEYNAVQQVMANAQTPVLLRQGIVAANTNKAAEELSPEAFLAATAKAAKRNGKATGAVNTNPAYQDDTTAGDPRTQRERDARIDSIKSLMTPSEIEAAKGGKLPYRIKQLLEERE